MAASRCRFAAIALVTTAALVAGACGDDSGGAAPTTTTTEAPSTTVAPEEDVLSAYRAYWDAFFEAGDPPDPDHPLLARHTTGGQLEAVRKLLEGDAAAGNARRGEVDLAPEITEIEDGTAVVEDCLHDRGYVVNAETGSTLAPEDPERQLVRTTLVQTDGRWKVEHTEMLEIGCEPDP